MREGARLYVRQVEERASHERRRNNGSPKDISTGNCGRRKYAHGTAFILRYRIRKPNGGWQEKSETLADSSSKKAALKVLSARLQNINEKNGRTASNQTERKLGDLLGSKWSQYLDNQSVKPSTRYAYDSILKKWIKPFFGDLLFEDIDADTIGRFMAHLARRNFQRSIEEMCTTSTRCSSRLLWI